MRYPQYLLVLFAVVLLVPSCSSREDRLAKKFVEAARQLDLEALSSVCTEDTQFWLKVTLEPMLSLGEAATLNQLKNMAGSLDCQEEDGTYFCRFLDEAEQKQSFKLSFVQENNTYGAKAWKVHIDERNFGID